MKTSNGGIHVSIMGKDLVVACPENEREALHAAARYLDEKMREVQETGRVIGMERCAIMAALNIANEFLELSKRASASTPELDKKLQFLHNRVTKALQEDFGPGL